jgi:putative redox protein
MTTIETIYIGQLRTKSKHLHSGVEIVTDAPLDNKGKGESFSPTDLLALSLGTCMLTTVGIAADNHGFNIDGTEVSITKIMASNPRRVSEIIVLLNFPDIQYTESQVRIIQHTALTCPVALSLHPDIHQNVSFNFKQ